MTDNLQAYFDWIDKEDRRVSHEWAKFNGTQQESADIADRQTNRAAREQARLGCAAELREFRLCEYRAYQITQASLRSDPTNETYSAKR